MADIRRRNMRTVWLGLSLLALAACNGEPLDFDLRNPSFGADTSGAARGSVEARPNPDDRGIISYPNFQVVVARRGDSIADVANRVGVDANTLARHNGIGLDAALRQGEVIALPGRVAEPSPATGAVNVGPIRPVEQVDITTLASGAIDRADAVKPPAPFQSKPAPTQSGTEPIRHKVSRGETAYSISRLYGISVRALADWNGLGPDLTVREGQFLLVPVVTPIARTPRVENDTPQPGSGSPTPTPPSASQPLPKETVVATVPTPPAPDLSKDRTSASGTARLLLPVQGKIIRGYEKRKNDGIDIAAPAGTPVKAAADGTIAAITRDTDQVPILVLRHPGNLLTVYANIEGITFEKGAKVSRGQTIARVRDSSPSFLHFEVREGLDSVDPMGYVN